jgi:hypothetical protein
VEKYLDVDVNNVLDGFQSLVRHRQVQCNSGGTFMSQKSYKSVFCWSYVRIMKLHDAMILCFAPECFMGSYNKCQYTGISGEQATLMVHLVYLN